MSDDDPNANIPPPPPPPPTSELPVSTPNNSGSAATSEIDEDFEARVLEKLQKLASGNGVEKDDVTIKQFKGNTLEFLATTTLTFRKKVVETTKAGKISGPKQISSPVALQEELVKEEHKITHRNDVIKKIQDALLERKDKGYGLNGTMIMMPFLYREFVIYEACQNCKARGEVACQRCRATGFEVCPQCKGQGRVMCSQCNGATFINTPQGRQQCQRCQNQGREICGLCNAKGKIQCSVCKTKKSTVCGICNGHKWNSHIHRAEFDAMTEFSYDKENVENKVGSLVDKLGADMLDHGHVHPIRRENEEKDAKDKRDFIAMPYLVKLPNAEYSFVVGKEEYNGMMFGYDATLTHIPNFIEKLISTGAGRLVEAAQNRGNVTDKIAKAGQYKTIRHAILASAKLPAQKAAIKVKQANPYGISKEKIMELVENADLALKNATRTQRIRGLFAGLASMIAIYGGYILSPARAELINLIPDPNQQAAADGLVLFAGVGIAITIVKMMAQGALSSALKSMVPKDKLRGYKSKTGKYGKYIYAAALPLYIIMCEASVHTATVQTPWWYEQLRNLIGL